MAPSTPVPTRKVGKYGPEVPALGFGLMGLSVGYGDGGSDEERFKVLDRAWELGLTNWDSASAYGDNEALLGKWFELHPERRRDIFLASKFSLVVSAEGISVDSTPETCRKSCEKSLELLGVDSIDLYYIHRLDDKTPVEKTIEAMVELKNEGKIKYFGISECSSSALRRACAVHHIAAVQVEYNPWSLEIEGEEGTNLLKTARELGVATFAYAPLGRGIMTGQFRSADDFEANDHRRSSPRFIGDNFAKNLGLVDQFKAVADRKGCTPAQLTLAWLLAQGNDVFPIPGTRKIKYLEDNYGAINVTLTTEEEKEIRKMVNDANIAGDRGATFGAYADSPAL